MYRLNKSQGVRWLLACLAVAFPAAELLAAPADGDATQQQEARAKKPVVNDVALDPQGRLHGTVVNLQGVPVARAPVVIYRDGREVARATTSDLGYYTVEKLGAGSHLVVVGDHGRWYRTWESHAAPPKTSQLALIIVGGSVVRGQWCLGDLVCKEAFITTAIVGAMIAVPIAVYQAGDDDKPSTP